MADQGLPGEARQAAAMGTGYRWAPGTAMQAMSVGETRSRQTTRAEGRENIPEAGP